MSTSRDRDVSFGSNFHPPLRVPPRGVRMSVQFVLLVAVGMFVLGSHGLTFDLTPWSQVMVNGLVGLVYSSEGQTDTAVVLFREKNLRELGANYPVGYEWHAEVFEALASYKPRSVFIDFVFMDERSNEERLREGMCRLSEAVQGRLYLAAPFDEEGRARMRSKFGGCARLVSALMDRDYGVSGVLTYCNGTWGSSECGERKDGAVFMPSPAFAMAQHRVRIVPEEAERMEIIWPGGTPSLNRVWMECVGAGDPKSGMRTRLAHDPLAVKEECPYTKTVSVGHLLGSFDQDVEAAIQGKAVFYGAGFEAAGDRVASPTYHDLPGVYLHAMAYDNLVSFKERYKRAERVTWWSLPAWRTGVADIGLLVILVAIWVLESNLGWSSGAKARQARDKRTDWAARSVARKFVNRMVLTVLILAGAGLLIASGWLGSGGALLWTIVLGYTAYRVAVEGDRLFLAVAALVGSAAVVSFWFLNLGPRNIVGYLAFFELARHLGERLDKAARKYVRLRGARVYDGQWGKWTGRRGLLDRVIGLWVCGKLEGERHEQTAPRQA